MIRHGKYPKITSLSVAKASMECILRKLSQIIADYTPRPLAFILAGFLLMSMSGISGARAEDDPFEDAPALKELKDISGSFDASPLPKYKGEFVSLGADGFWHEASNMKNIVYGSATGSNDVKQNCSPEALIHYAKAAPASFKYEKKGLLYGVKTHTSATRLKTRFWDMPGFNSCALVVYAILKKAGCRWAHYTANAKAIYDMAYRAGWKPTNSQRGGCIVAWNSRWSGGRARIGTLQKQVKNGSTAFRHVGITTGSWMSVDNSSWRSRPTRFLTFRPLVYEAPFFLCPPQ